MALKQPPKIYHPDFRIPKKKPVGGVEIDRSDKYGKNVFAAWNFATRESWLLDYGSGKLADLVGTSKSLAVSDNNQVLRSVAGANNHRLNLGSINSANPISLSATSTGGEYTIFFRCKPTSTTPSLPGRIIDKSDGGNGANGWMIQAFNNSFDMYVGGAVRLQVGISGLSGKWMDCAITVGGGNGTFYVNSATNTGTVPSTSTSTTNAAISNWNHSTDRNWDGDIAYIHMHYGTYSKNQVKEYWSRPNGIFKPKQQPVYFTAEAGGTITVNGITPNYTYASVAGAIDLTGLISVTGSTPNYAYSPISGTIDLTPTISVTGATPNYTYSAIAGTVETPGTISITGLTPNYTYAPVAGAITLQGTITVTGETPNYTYASVRGIVTDGLTVYSNSFVGFAPDQGVFSGVVKSATFSGIISETSDFSGYAKATTFLGVKQ